MALAKYELPAPTPEELERMELAHELNECRREDDLELDQRFELIIDEH